MPCDTASKGRSNELSLQTNKTGRIIMNTTRTLYSRNVFAAAALALIGSVAAVPVQAQQLSRAEVRAATAQAIASGEVDALLADSYASHAPSTTSQRSRADVRAEAERGIADGSIAAMTGESYATAVPKAGQGTLTRAEVRAATVQAARSGRLDAQLGESYGTGPVASRTARDVL